MPTNRLELSRLASNTKAEWVLHTVFNSETQTESQEHNHLHEKANAVLAEGRRADGKTFKLTGRQTDIQIKR